MFFFTISAILATGSSSWHFTRVSTTLFESYKLASNFVTMERNWTITMEDRHFAAKCHLKTHLLRYTIETPPNAITFFTSDRL